MRIRRRPPFSSPPAPSPSLLEDPSRHPAPITPSGKDSTASNGGGARWGKGAQELHQDGHPPEDSHGFAQDPSRRIPIHPRPPPPCLDPSGETKRRSINCGAPTHLTDVGHGEVQDFEEVATAKGEEERGILVDSKMRWDDGAEQVNSNKRTDSSSGASILLEAARQLEAAAMVEKRKKRNGGCDARKVDGDYYGSDERLKKMGNLGKERASSCGGAHVASVRNNCTSVNGSDNDGHRSGNGPAAVMEEDKGGVVVNGSGRTSGKKRRSPAMLMEGSRCSRVNGRGWRCCQQTLVGYSLCEHHLGKGRLRSMSSVRGQIGATTRPKKNSKTTTASSSTAQEEKDEEQQRQQEMIKSLAVDGDTEKPEMLEVGGDNGENNAVKKEKKKRKKKKMGMVKARSISSLLDGAIA